MEEFFVRFHDMSGNQVLELTADKPSGLLRKMMKNSEAISNLRYDHHTSNLSRYEWKREEDEE